MNERSANATVQRKQKWFKEMLFRQAVSAAIDREAVVRLVYRGLGDPIDVPVTQGNALWRNTNLRTGGHSLGEARSCFAMVYLPGTTVS